ncbi:C40 family peptidase [Martelella endophytica]|uniref:Peptidase P60 n=1 Tax=Martelella endophytica TaxID=1486262 RepID=A0A0D5LVV7_MAREN|nr:C40 family peptidase [Martelella endophytica]AJY47523.1 peptidase P60 [Martelella endophytica]
MELDRRLHAFRPDLADQRLSGLVKAERFAEPIAGQVIVPVAPLRGKPLPAAGVETQLLFGEAVDIFERRDGWAWVQSRFDCYVGYLPEEMIAEGEPAATHIIAAPRTFLYPEAELKMSPVCALSMGTRLAFTDEAETRGTRYLVSADGTAVFADHCFPIGRPFERDPVKTALRFLETPYLWGGRSGFGVDCSGLVQLAMLMAGRSVPRDSDMQELMDGEPVNRRSLKRGDLVFWKGHVGIMEDEKTLIHANGATMRVTRENLDHAITRIAPFYGNPTSYLRPAKLG